VFGSKDFYKKQWTDEKYKDVDGREKWIKEWRRRRFSHFSFVGSSDETNGNSLC
jgi:hypothetical protein